VNKRKLKKLYFDDFRAYDSLRFNLSQVSSSIEGAVDAAEEGEIFTDTEINSLLKSSDRMSKLQQKIEEVDDALKRQGWDTAFASTEEWQEGSS
jgi:hypothetical protein